MMTGLVQHRLRVEDEYGQSHVLAHRSAWQSRENVPYPQMITLELENMSYIDEIRILCDQFQSPTKCSITINDSNLGECNFKDGAIMENGIEEIKCISIEKSCSRIVIQIHNCHKNQYNSMNQVSLKGKVLLGSSSSVDSNIVNSTTKKIGEQLARQGLKETIRRQYVLLEQRIHSLLSAKQLAVDSEDFQNATELKTELENICHQASQIIDRHVAGSAATSAARHTIVSNSLIHSPFTDKNENISVVQGRRKMKPSTRMPLVLSNIVQCKIDNQLLDEDPLQIEIPNDDQNDRLKTYRSDYHSPASSRSLQDVESPKDFMHSLIVPIDNECPESEESFVDVLKLAVEESDAAAVDVDEYLESLVSHFDANLDLFTRYMELVLMSQEPWKMQLVSHQQLVDKLVGSLNENNAIEVLRLFGTFNKDQIGLALTDANTLPDKNEKGILNRLGILEYLNSSTTTIKDFLQSVATEDSSEAIKQAMKKYL